MNQGKNQQSWKDTVMQTGYQTQKTLNTQLDMFLRLGAVISQKSSKQTLLAKSTMEYEFIALEKAANEA